LTISNARHNSKIIAAPNNGMHPTGDTTAVMKIQSRGMLGDAGR